MILHQLPKLKLGRFFHRYDIIYNIYPGLLNQRNKVAAITQGPVKIQKIKRYSQILK